MTTTLFCVITTTLDAANSVTRRQEEDLWSPVIRGGHDLDHCSYPASRIYVTFNNFIVLVFSPRFKTKKGRKHSGVDAWHFIRQVQLDAIIDLQKRYTYNINVRWRLSGGRCDVSFCTTQLVVRPFIIMAGS